MYSPEQSRKLIYLPSADLIGTSPPITGFKLNSEKYGKDIIIKPVIVGSIAEAVQSNKKRFDYILISTKCLPPFSAMPESIRPAVSENHTSIVLFQNGIGIEDPYAAAYPLNPIISVAIYIKATETATAVVEHNHIEFLRMGTFPANAPDSHKLAISKFAALLKAGGSDVTVYDDVQKERWTKALLNAPWNPTSALTRLGDATFISIDKRVEGMMRDAMREVAAVARACGHDIGEEQVETLMRIPLSNKLPGLKYSMLFDAVEEKPMEVDAVVGNIVAAGEQKGVKTPLLTMLLLLIKGLNSKL